MQFWSFKMQFCDYLAPTNFPHIRDNVSTETYILTMSAVIKIDLVLIVSICVHREVVGWQREGKGEMCMFKRKKWHDSARWWTGRQKETIEKDTNVFFFFFKEQKPEREPPLNQSTVLLGHHCFTHTALQRQQGPKVIFRDAWVHSQTPNTPHSETKVGHWEGTSELNMWRYFFSLCPVEMWDYKY